MDIHPAFQSHFQDVWHLVLLIYKVLLNVYKVVVRGVKFISSFA
ncbi:MAG: hypothetical protein ACI8TS_000777 [Flavobacteriales bacterium]|jgi:hypothetical protein